MASAASHRNGEIRLRLYIGRNIDDRSVTRDDLPTDNALLKISHVMGVEAKVGQLTSAAKPYCAERKDMPPCAR